MNATNAVHNINNLSNTQLHSAIKLDFDETTKIFKVKDNISGKFYHRARGEKSLKTSTKGSIWQQLKQAKQFIDAHCLTNFSIVELRCVELSSIEEVKQKLQKISGTLSTC